MKLHNGLCISVGSNTLCGQLRASGSPYPSCVSSSLAAVPVFLKRMESLLKRMAHYCWSFVFFGGVFSFHGNTYRSYQVDGLFLYLCH